MGSPNNELDYLLATSDLRVGALSFGPTPTPREVDYSAALPMGALDRAADAASALEAGVAGEPVELDIDPGLLSPSSGVGGARPKTIVIDDHDQLWIAKFPSRQDRFNNAAAERVRDSHRCVGSTFLNSGSWTWGDGRSWRSASRKAAPDIEIADRIEHAFPESYPGFEYASLG